MPTQNPRINVVLEPDLYSILNQMAKKSGVSLSFLSRDLIKDALETKEDVYWQNIAQKREKTFSIKEAVSHKDIWNE